MPKMGAWEVKGGPLVKVKSPLIRKRQTRERRWAADGAALSGRVRSQAVVTEGIGARRLGPRRARHTHRKTRLFFIVIL